MHRQSESEITASAPLRDGCPRALTPPLFPPPLSLNLANGPDSRHASDNALLAPAMLASEQMEAMTTLPLGPFHHPKCVTASKHVGTGRDRASALQRIIPMHSFRLLSAMGAYPPGLEPQARSAQIESKIQSLSRRTRMEQAD